MRCKTKDKVEFKNMCKLTPALTVIVNLIQIRMTVFAFCLCSSVWMQCEFSLDTNIYGILNDSENIKESPFTILEDTRITCNIRPINIIYRVSSCVKGHNPIIK